MHLARIWTFTLFVAILFGSSAFAQSSKVESNFKVKTDSKVGVLAVQFSVPEGWHCYSTTQLPGGPLKSKITVTGEGVKVTGDFVPRQPPKQAKVEGFDVICEKHHGVVIWEAPVQFDAGVDPAKVALAVKYRGQILSLIHI